MSGIPLLLTEKGAEASAHVPWVDPVLCKEICVGVCVDGGGEVFVLVRLRRGYQGCRGAGGSASSRSAWQGRPRSVGELRTGCEGWRRPLARSIQLGSVTK